MRMVFTLSEAEKENLGRVRDALGQKSDAGAIRTLISLAIANPNIMGGEAPPPRPVPRSAIKEANIMRRRAAAPLDTSTVPVLDRASQREAFLARQKPPRK